MFERLSHFNYAEELLKLLSYSYFNIRKNEHSRKRSLEALKKLAESKLDHDIKHKFNFLLDVYK